MKWETGLSNWRAVRRIVEPQDNYTVMMSEEVGEYREAVKSDDWHEQVDAICDMLVLTTNQITTEQAAMLDRPIELMSIIEDIELLLENYEFGADNSTILHSIDSFCREQLIALGVVPDLAMKQVVKHISSRVIDPTKQADWDAGLLSKWPKDPNQEPDTIYEPNYNLCRLQNRSHYV